MAGEKREGKEKRRERRGGRGSGLYFKTPNFASTVWSCICYTVMRSCARSTNNIRAIYQTVNYVTHVVNTARENGELRF